MSRTLLKEAEKQRTEAVRQRERAVDAETAAKHSALRANQEARNAEYAQRNAEHAQTEAERQRELAQRALAAAKTSELSERKSRVEAYRSAEIARQAEDAAKKNAADREAEAKRANAATAQAKIDTAEAVKARGEAEAARKIAQDNATAAKQAQAAAERTLAVVKLQDKTVMGRYYHAIMRHDAPVSSAVFSPNQVDVFSVSGGIARLWESEKVIASLSMENPITAATFDHDYRTFMLGDNQGNVELADATGSKVQKLDTGFHAPIQDLQVHSKASDVSVATLLAYTGHELRAWKMSRHPPTLSVEPVFSQQVAGTIQVARLWSDQIAIGTATGRLMVWDLGLGGKLVLNISQAHKG